MTPDIDREPEVEHAAAQLPWWRRPRRLRRQLTGTLVIVALVSVALAGGLNFVAARNLLDDGTRDQLIGVGEARARSIDLGVDRVLGQVSALAADLAVVDALGTLSDGFETLDDVELTSAEEQEFERRYQELVVDPLNDAGLGLDVTFEQAAPAAAGRFAQLQYTLIDDLENRRVVADAGDGSDYSAAHAEHHDELVRFAEVIGFGDLLLIDRDGTVVYSVEKQIDFATNLRDGPHRNTRLADTVTERLSRVPVGEAVLSDMEIYVPGGAQSVMFVAASVRRDTEVIGALAVQIPVAALNAITTAGESWDDVGLSSGESYVVGPDRVLVSESRRWIEDPDGYLDRADGELASQVRVLGSPVGLQPVDTEPVEEALEGRIFEGTTKNYLGERTFSYATPITAAGVDWIVVVDVPLSDARSPLYDYALQLGLILVVILPVSAIVGLWLAGRLTRSIPPVVAAALAVAEGDRDPDVPVGGRDEFGDLARRLKKMAAELERQEAALAAEYDERRELIMTVLPRRIVHADGAVDADVDVVEDATVVAVSVQTESEDLTADDGDIAGALRGALAAAERLATERGIERIVGSTDHYLFVAGLGVDGVAADAALEFAAQLPGAIAAASDEHDIGLVVRVGLASGAIATGMLERGSLTFGAWGEPVRQALAIGALAGDDEVLLDASTAMAADADRWSLRPAADVVALDGEPMELFTAGERQQVPPSG